MFDFDKLSKQPHEQSPGLLAEQETPKSLDDTSKLMHHLKLILECAGEGIFGIDIQGNHTFVNPKAANLLGYTIDEMTGAKSHALWHHSHPDGTRYECEDCPIYETLKDGKTHHNESYVWRKDGSGFYIDFTSMPIFENGKITGAVVTFLDISDRKKLEKESKQSMSDMHRAEEYAKFGNWNFYFDDNVVQASEGAKIIYGLDSSINPIDDIQSLALPEYRRMLDNALKELIENNIPYNVDYKIKRKSDGKIVDINSKKEYDRINNIAFGVIQDITEKKQKENEILKFRRAVETSGEAIFLTDENGIITYVNPEFTKLYDYYAEEVIGKTTPRILKSGEFDKDFYNLFWNTLFKNHVVKYEIINRTKDGKKLDIESSVNSILDENQNIIGFLAVQRDISERKKADEINMLHRKKLQTIIDKLPNYIFVKDIDGTYLMANNAFANLFKLTPDEILFKKDDELILNKKELSLYHDDDLEVLAKNTSILFNSELVNAETNEKYYVQTTKLPYDYPGWNKPCILGISTDVSELKNKEKELIEIKENLEKINSEKDKFFSIIAHDIKTPFTGFLGLTKIIAEEYQNLTIKEVQEFGKNMQDSANNLYKLLENLLEWSSMQRGSTRFNPETCPLKYLVELNIDIVNEFAKQKSIQFINKVSDNSVVTADIPMLNTVLRNLISNAVKFTPREGKIEIGASFNTGDNCMEIYIKDSGIGMNDDTIIKLFKMDKKATRPGTEGEPSTGLGLLLCKEFVERHGGKIRVESEEGKGSTFYFTLSINGL